LIFTPLDAQSFQLRAHNGANAPGDEEH